MQKILVCCLLSVAYQQLYAQDSTAKILEQVTVTANINSTELLQTARNISVITARQIAQSPVKTIDGILQYALNVDVRTRSPFGVQADIGIRGGHFDQTLIMIDGVKMNDPQTGHHAFNLPVPINQIEKIEVLQGGASRIFGPAAFSGVINVITKKVTENALQLNAGAGQHRLSLLNGSVNLVKDNFSTFVSAERITSDGYVANTDFDRRSLYAKTGFFFNKTTLTLQGGTMQNNFGASNFYQPKFKEQYEEIGSNFLIGKWTQDVSKKMQSNVIVSLRQHADSYDFNNFRVSNPGAVNHHRTDIFDAEWKVNYLNKFGKTAVGLEWRRERIMSNRLGNKIVNPVEVPRYFGQFYDKSFIRTNGSAFFEHQLTKNKFTVVFGTMYNLNSQFGNQWFPGLDVSYRLNDITSMYASVNRSLRFPTFTEMYLNSATVVGNPDLKPESALSYEIGYKNSGALGQFTASLFARNADVAIDKIQRPNQTVPSMENISDLSVYGFELSGVIAVTKLLPKFPVSRINTNYSFTNANQKADGFQSFYSLNYLRHKFFVGTTSSLGKKWNLGLNYTFKQREGAFQLDAETLPVNYRPVHLVDVRLSWSIPKITFYADINNLLNYNYFEFGFVEQPGRWISSGLSLNL